MPNPLFEFAHVPQRALAELQALAEEEDWEYQNSDPAHPLPILFSYLQYTYRRLDEEGKVKIAPNGNAACFDTGLLDRRHLQPIYAYFEPNDRASPPWRWVRFCVASHNCLSSLHPLPEMARYFESTSELLYDDGLQIIVNYDHIMDDRRDRWPEPLASYDESRRRRDLQGAIESAKARLRRNYKIAVPQYYWDWHGVGRVQLLIPLCLTSETKPDLALPIENKGNHYAARTPLNLDWAYRNARLVATPSREWLKPAEIEAADGLSEQP